MSNTPKTYDAGSGCVFTLKKRKHRDEWATGEVTGKNGNYHLSVESSESTGWGFILSVVGENRGRGACGYTTAYRAMDAAVDYLWRMDRGNTAEG